MPYYDDPSVRYDDPAIFYDDPGLGYSPGSLQNQTLPPLGTNAMEYWEITKDRAQKTLAVWNQHTPTIKVGGLGPADLDTLIDQFEPLAQARTTAQDNFDAATRGVKTALLKMKILGTKVAQIIDAQVPDTSAIIDDLNDVFRIVPRSEPTILARARALQPIWVRADAQLATLTPPAGPITRPIQGVAHTAAMLKTLLDGYTDVTNNLDTKETLYNSSRGDLRVLDRKVDQLSKNWYQVVKNTYDPGSPEYEALAQIPTEGGTPAPEPVELNPLEQGGDDGLHVLASYVPGGGDHATTKLIEYMIEGVEADFGHEAPLDPSGNTLGPFVVGQVVKVRTKVSNSTATRTSAVRTITIEEPL